MKKMCWAKYSSPLLVEKMNKNQIIISIHDEEHFPETNSKYIKRSAVKSELNTLGILLLNILLELQGKIII